MKSFLQIQKTNQFLFLFSIIISLHTISNHTHIYDTKKRILFTAESSDNPFHNSGSLRLLQNSFSTAKIKLHLDFSNIEKGVDEDQVAFVRDLLAKFAAERLEDFLSVTGTHVVPKLPEGACKDEDTPIIPDTYYNQTTDADMILFFSIKYLKSNILAYATSCARDPSTFRPLAGQVVYNSHHAWAHRHYFLNSYATLIHEIIHTLGFDPSMYPYYTKVDGNSPFFVSKGVYNMTSSQLLTEARNHFSCSNISRIPMENEGSSGSSGAHFERTLFGNETMVSEDIQVPILSKFTLAILKDSGFYKVDMQRAEYFDWGKDRGCDFLDDDMCSSQGKFPEICHVKDQLSCDPLHNYITKCKTTTFTDNCMLNDKRYGCNVPYQFENFKDNEEYPKDLTTFGKGTRCMTYSGSKSQLSATCVKTTCDLTGSSYILHFNDKDIFKCEKKGAVITIDDYSFTCLDPVEFCGIKNVCPDNCNFNGECLLDGTCRCNPFHSGNACETYIGCDEKLANICSHIKAKNKYGNSMIFRVLKYFAMWIFLFN